jgi:hypothetical protein
MSCFLWSPCGLLRVRCVRPDVRNGPVSEFASAQLDDRFQHKADNQLNRLKGCFWPQSGH